MDGVVCRDRAVLPEGRQWPTAYWSGADAAHHFLQHWFNLADLACEEALYDSASLRRFVGIDPGRPHRPPAPGKPIRRRNSGHSTDDPARTPIRPAAGACR